MSLLACASAIPLVAIGQTPTLIPYVFANGTVADAEQINANFQSVASYITDQQNRLHHDTNVIGEAEFQGRSAGATVERGTNHGGAWIANNAMGGLIAPTRIPLGATIDGASVYIDDSSSDRNIEACLILLSGAGDYFGRSCATSAGATGNAVLSIQGLPEPQIDAVYDLTISSLDNAGNLDSWPGVALVVRLATVSYSRP